MPPPPLPPLAAGPFLYRYGSADHLEWLEPLIVRHELYIPSAADFNDLRDVRPRLMQKTAAEWAEYLNSRGPHTRLSEDQSGLVGQLDDVVAEIGADRIHEMATTGWHHKTRDHRIYCLSKRWDNLSMWEWYGAKQTGYCLEFANAGLFADVRDVVYKPPPPYDLTDIASATSASWFFYKYPDWSNEEEVRLVLARKQGGPTFQVGSQLLRRIIVGEGMTEANVGCVKEMVRRREPPIPVLTAKWDEIRSEFALI